MDIIWLLIRASWGNMLVAAIAGLVSGGASAWVIALINTAIDHDDPQTLISPFVALALLALVASSLSQLLLVNLSQDAVYRLRLQLSQRILSSPLQTLEHLGPSQLLAVLTEDVQAVSNTVFAIPTLCVNVAIIMGCLAYLGFLSGWALVAVVAFLGVAIACVQILIAYAYRYLALSRHEIDRLFEHFRGITGGIKELKLNKIRQQIFFEKDLQVSAATSRRYAKIAFAFATFTNSLGRLLFFMLMGLLLFGLPRLLPAVQAVLPAYILTMTYILGPIENTIEMLPNLANANVSIQKVNKMGLQLSEVTELPSVVKSSVVTQPACRNWHKLELNSVMHTYRQNGQRDAQGETDQSFTLGPIDITFTAGELVFIIGGNGSGKSTLAKLITGLYISDSGSLQLDGQFIDAANREGYRQYFSTVFSDFYLFERLFDPETLTTHEQTVHEQVQHFLQKLQLEKKVSVQDGQLSTLSLSQGQRKRLALLSAYLEDRPIYLFDEWASDQDPIFREIFYTQLLPELKQRGKTILVISHDDHYFHVADRIIKLNYGRIELDQRAEPES